jgi:hypothetical protein
MLLSSRRTQPPVDCLWSWSHRFQDKLYNSDSFFLFLFFVILLLIIHLWCPYMYETWSWHTYRYAFGFVLKTGCDTRLIGLISGSINESNKMSMSKFYKYQVNWNKTKCSRYSSQIGCLHTSPLLFLWPPPKLTYVLKPRKLKPLSACPPIQLH